MAKQVPFYRTCTCNKVVGGKRPLWHARFTSEAFLGMTRNGFSGGEPVGAGNTADNAIKDLAEQVRRRMRMHDAVPAQ